MGTQEFSVPLPNHLTLYFIPSPHGINWSSPKSLFLSILKNYFAFKHHFMGHVQVEVSCASQPQYNFFAGMRAKTMDAKTQIFIKQKGLGVLFHKFPGHLEGPEDRPQTIKRMIKEAPSQLKRPCCFLSIKITEQQCKRLYDYYQAYKKNGMYRYYGLVCRPRHGEGAGCSAFAASFLDILGLINDELKRSWTYQLQLPKALTGKPVYEQKIAPFRFLQPGAGSSWAAPGEDSTELSFWEPDKMIDWILSKRQEEPQHALDIQGVKGWSMDGSEQKLPQDKFFSPHHPQYFPELNSIKVVE